MNLEKLLQALDSESARLMLEDLKDPEKRTPQLYNAIGKLLDRHKFNISKVQPDESILGELASALPDDVTESDLYTIN
ncbi:DNA packaging protein A [Vibrio phage JSF24]|jgi:hypothetical protein|uniref:DNA packaging protein A n=19 Tax=Chatterjeevirus TaxID=2732679 RepID=A0A2D0Z4U1_9CAUD|nr:terminase small subunit [Vibrio phage ICP3]ADX87536.1 DNA packaging protein A [Vibrio phage ICP3_2009_B]ADX87584.1 DNA packaging protein A [Vibrio phage ICP3_2009_A]ADX87632.1 DNA packaging protein A [Vibrio phage ICP3_2008_A]ADX87679.1 DNA packaging protein [Vibrio phage ICP3_2007_A]ASU01129.1 DNA packaging protein A [Vibrio phage JSF25]ASV42759.1 DNA packaging protein A [Vibrio phage JSF11]ASV42854.1 DNA packaging protein A [Vibrio phage JSF28]ASV42897.1 DNA packaging protein A [Vibrio